ncbi:hypothetical protein ASD79_00935 [Caulobacter sp. Root655]|uniref:ABC transporter permease n=1 Tax=Caulobacter sp. Root655 TaxID=1736578 RepID=UPI0006F452ED|nr:ABC transporter permease [Caulobacter sp. Root655]KRA65880.1 hypothetical protein ASD79_00935 [Caulobacter sp. Root655]
MALSIPFGVMDFFRGVKQINIAWYLAFTDIGSRYHRTALGPLWVVVAQGVWVLGLGYVQSQVFHVDFSKMTIYLAAGLPVWVFLTANVTDGAAALLRAKGMVTSFPLPLSLYPIGKMLEQMILLFHQMIIFVVACLLYRFVPNWRIIEFIPALLIVSVGMLGLNLGLGVLGARFRDVRPALASLMTLGFVVTPVFWFTESVGRHSLIVKYNPFYYMLELMRAPLMGVTPPLEIWVTSSLLSAVFLVSGLWAFASTRKTVVSWL